MTEKTSPSQLSPNHLPHASSPSTPPFLNPSSAYASATLPPSFVPPSSTGQCAGQSSATLSSSIRPSTKPLTSPKSAQSFTPSAQPSFPTSSLNPSALPPASAFTPICPASPHSSTRRSSHNLSSTPPSSVPPSPQMRQRTLQTSCNQLPVSSSHNSLDGEVQVSDIYFVSTHF